MHCSTSSYNFINLTNGIEAITKYNLNLPDVRFLRIQSTACEQKHWEQIIRGLSPDFLLLAALGKQIVIYDFSNKRKIPRSLWQGLEWIKFVLYRKWFNKVYSPSGRAQGMKNYFNDQYSQLSQSTKAMLSYYKKFLVGDIKINFYSDYTTCDGDYEYYKSVLCKL